MVNYSKISILILFCFYSFSAQAENTNTQKWADSLLTLMKEKKILDSKTGIKLSDSISRFYKSKKQTCNEIEALTYLSSYHTKVGNYPIAVQLLQDIFDSSVKNCKPGVSSTISIALSSMYLSTQDYVKANALVEDWLKSPVSLSWSLKEKADLRFNQGIALANLERLDEAMFAFREMHKLGLLSNDQESIELGLMNMATLYALKENFRSAKKMYEEVLKTARKNQIDDHLFRAWQNLGSIYFDEKKPHIALLYLDSAKILAKKNGDLEGQIDVLQTLANLYNKGLNYKSAYNSSVEMQILKDSLLNIQKLKAVTELGEKYESEKKTKENIILKNNKLQLELDNSKIVRSRNTYLFIGLAILGIAGGLFGRLRFVSKSKNEIERQKGISEKLLLNILPYEVAQELKDKGEAKAVHFDDVTVLFTDFKGFTALSEMMSAQDLVRDLNECFTAFDQISEKYGIEKIKTIGDSYMAVGGLPTLIPDHAKRVVNAGLEMAEFIHNLKTEKMKAALPFFEVRIGIHSGPVVAGIVGFKKMQYDIWGNSVNMASRMESSGEIGRVNISNVTYERIRYERNFVFESRGKIEAKGKGELEMWFVKRNEDFENKIA